MPWPLIFVIVMMDRQNDDQAANSSGKAREFLTETPLEYYQLGMCSMHWPQKDQLEYLAKLSGIFGSVLTGLKAVVNYGIDHRLRSRGLQSHRADLLVDRCSREGRRRTSHI